MPSIIRAPEIAEERRKLTTRRARAEQAGVPAAALAPAIAAIPEAAPAPAATAPPIHAAQARPAPALPVVPHAVPQQPQQPVPPAAPVAQAPDMARIVAKAEAAARTQFKDEADAARDAAVQRGLEEGRKRGAEEVVKSFEPELARLVAIAGKLEGAMAAGFQGLEEMAVAIAFEAVCKLMGSAAHTPQGIRALVDAAAQHALYSERVAVRLHPRDLAMLEDAGALDKVLASGAAVAWSADQSIALGGCILDTGHGDLDARLETQLERLRATLVEARKQAA